MADPISLSIQHQQRLDSSTRAIEEIPNFVMQGIKIPGIQAQNRILRNEAIESDRQLSINEQVGDMIKNPFGFVAEFGNLNTAADMRKFMAKYAVIAASPQGRNIMAQFDRAATLTEDAEKSSVANILRMEYTKKSAAIASKLGINPDDPNFHEKVSVAMEAERNFQPRETVLPSGVIQIETAPGEFQFFSPRTSSTGVLPEIERTFQIAANEGNPFSEDIKRQAREYRLGLKARPGVTKPEISKSAFIAKNYASELKREPFKTQVVPGRFFDGTKETPLTPEEIIVDLGNKYDQIYGGSSESVTQQESDPTSDKPMVRQNGVIFIWNGSSYEPVK